MALPEYSRLLSPDRMAASETLIGHSAICIGGRFSHELSRLRMVFDRISQEAIAVATGSRCEEYTSS